jgi:hypothetical protein
MLIAGVSCSPDKPLRPGNSSPASVGFSSDEVAMLVGMLEDARLRILPGLGDSAATTELGAALEALAAGAAIGERNTVGVRLRGARRAIEQYGGPANATWSDPADLAAIRLAVERFAALATPQSINEQD